MLVHTSICQFPMVHFAGVRSIYSHYDVHVSWMSEKLRQILLKGISTNFQD